MKYRYRQRMYMSVFPSQVFSRHTKAKDDQNATHRSPRTILTKLITHLKTLSLDKL